MKRLIVVFVCLILILGVIPKLMNYQGKLTTEEGIGYTGLLPMNFRIYTSESGGEALWEKNRAAVDVSQGLFSVPLGIVNPFPSNVDFS